MWTKGSPPHPLPKNFFQVGPLVPAAGRWGANNGPWTGKTGRGRYCAFLFLLLVRMACRAQRTFERMSGIKQKRGGQSAFRVLCHERRPLCQRAVLVLAIFAGGPAMGAVRRRSGASILLHKARWEEDGAWGKEGPLRASWRPKAAAGRARCDEGSYGHRQQGKVPLSPKKLAYMWKKRRGGTPGIMRASASLR